MSDIRLKPCPFCGGEAILKHNRYFNGQDSYIQCSNCLASGIEIAISTEYSSDEKAAEGWNMRVKEEV